MTKEEILAKAQKDYPVGTEFMCLERAIPKTRHDSSYHHNGFYWGGCTDNGEQLLGMVSKHTGAWVYKHGVWATITKAVGPKQLPIFN